MTHSSVLISADVFDSGRVELYESSAAALVNLSGDEKLLLAASAASAGRARLEQPLVGYKQKPAEAGLALQSRAIVICSTTLNKNDL